MTDLENLWDDLPTGTPPVDAILRAGRASVARRRILTRPLIALAASAALIAAFVAGSVVGDLPGPRTGQPHSDPSPVAFQADLKPAQSCDQLLTSYRDRALALVSEWGWGQGEWSPYVYSTELSDSASVRRLAGRPSQTASATGTNVQETGVDEPDTVKTDGKLVVRLRGDDLLVYDASGTKVVKQSTINLPRFEDGEILLVGTTVVVIGADQLSPRDDMTGMRRGSRVVTVSLTKPSKPTIESTVTYSSRVLSARQHGSVVRLVLGAGLPALGFAQPDGEGPEGTRVTKQQALVANRRAVETSTIKDWLPSYDFGKGSEQLLDCTNVAVPPDTLGLDTVSVVGFKASAPTQPEAIGLAGAATIAYESAGHLFLADGPTQLGCRMCLGDRAGAVVRQGSGTTHLYDFELDGVYAIHVASGEVEGTIADRWSIDEADDVLRLAVGPSSETGNFNSVVTLRRKGQELVEIGRLGQLGKNEELKGVRWFDGLAVLVTYRQVDPLFTIDLVDPAHPRLIGKLKIPGYSDYLHPLGDDEMLGIGYGGGNSWGAQIALFDVSDLAHVRRTDIENYPGADAIATWEPRAFTWLPEHDTVLTVLQKGDSVKVAALKIRNGHLSSTLTNVEYGDDAAQVRTLGLPDGRIILVTGEDVRFFSLR